MEPDKRGVKRRKKKTTLNQGILIFGFGAFFFANGLFYWVEGKSGGGEALYVNVLITLMGAFMTMAGFRTIHNVVRRLVGEARRTE